MQFALRPVAVRGLLLLAGILLGLVTIVAAFAVADGTGWNAAAVSADSPHSSHGDNTLVAGTRWR
jgi:hypothetical protein